MWKPVNYMRKRNIVGWEEALKNQPDSYKKWFAEERKYIIKSIKKNSKVLEVGCGDGRSIKDVLEVTKDVTGIDNDETAIEHSKENLKNYSSVKLILGDGKNLPFQDEIFDYVTCIGTFANLGDDKYQILSEMKRILKKNGKIIISVYSDKAIEERLKLYRKLKFKMKEIRNNGTIIFDDPTKEGISEQFSKEQLKGIAKKSDLKVEDITEVNIAYLCIFSK